LRIVLSALGLFSSLITPNAAPLQRVANTTLAMPPAPPTYGYTVTNAFGALNFFDPVCIASPPGETNRLFVVERGGTIAVITNLAAPTRSVFLNISSKVTANLEECGLLSMVFHPGYATNGNFFVWYYGPDTTTAGSGAHDILSRFTVSAGNSNSANAVSEVKFIRQFDENQYHNAGDMHFGPDGFLYLSLGDEGGSDGSYNNDQAIDQDLFSGLIRIDVDKRVGNLPNPHPAASTNYTIPPDNPFIGATSFNGTSVNPAEVRTEFWAVGMRNPWRWNFDPVTGRLYLGDVGQNAQEEVNIVVKGGNYGWAYVEGCISGPKTPPVGFSSIAPILCYPHGSAANQGYCIIGGPVYRGTRYSQLTGAYIYGDNVSGHLWSLTYNGTNVTSSQTLIAGGVVGLSSFGIDPRNGDVLLAIRGVEGSSSTTQPLKRLIYSSATTGPVLPPTLNDTGAFTNLNSLTPNAGIVAYDLNVPFWSDNAIKTRWFSIPNTNLAIDYSPTNNWQFPTGTVWIKQFDLQTNSSPPVSTRVETRLLVKTTNGIYGVTYRWGGATNATLVPEAGMDESFVINNSGVLSTQLWHYPGRFECSACHTPIAGYALGVNAPQFHRNMTYAGGTTNQLQALSDAGYFTSSVTDIPSVTPLASPTNAGYSVEYRARSYLAANCVHCHQPGGAGLGLWDARFSTPINQCGITNGPLIDNLGNPNNRVILPGSISNSVMLTRVANFGNIHMPPLATSVINTQSVRLLSAWITNYVGNPYLDVSPAILEFGPVPIASNSPAIFLLSNNGGVPITNGVATVSGGPFTILSGTPFNLPAFGTTNLVVRFTPGAVAGFTNNLIVTTGNGGNVTNKLAGAGVTPAQLVVTPGSMDFGTVIVGTNVQGSFVVTNLGGQALNGGAASVNGGPFTILSGTPFNLPGFGTTNLVVRFAPTNNAASTNKLIVTSAYAGNVTNQLSGIGLTPAQLAVSPAILNFGVLAVGSNVQASFVVTNRGGQALTGGAASLNTGPFSILSGTPFSLPGFGTTNLLLRFAPTNAASFANNATFTSGNGGNVTNQLVGLGAIAPIADFSALPTIGDWPLSALFTNRSTGTISNSLWNFGDNTTTNTSALAFTHVYPALGSNTVSLTVTGPLGTNTLTRPAYIVVTNVAPVTLTILATNNQVQLLWREGILQSAGAASDSYTNVPGASSPYTVGPDKSTLFFQVKVR